MIEILYLFLCYIPFTILSITNLSFIISNSFYFAILPLVNLYNNIVPYPFYYDIISLTSNYLIVLLYYFRINGNSIRWSSFVEGSIKYLTNYFSLFIFLGVEYIWRFNNIFDSIFGLFLLSWAYLYYPILHRIYFGQNNRTWRRKVDYYYSYFKESLQYSFVIDILEGLLLGLLTIGFYYNMKNKEYLYLGLGILKLIYHFLKPIAYNYTCIGKYYYIVQFMFILIDITCVFLNDYHNFIYLYLINSIFQLGHNLLILYLNPVNKYRLIIRESISLPDIYFEDV